MATKNLELKLYDTLTREKRVFNPIDPARVRMYVCGQTVYDFAHIGNARPVIVFDVLYRLLRHLYGPEHVTYVRNITDVDDKINARAAERGISIRELTEETYNNFKSDVAALGCLPPTVEPRATDYVSNPGAPVDMIRLIERLIANGNAYAAEGHVLFAVATMSDYGKLSKRSLDEMVAGARVEVAPYKRDPMDFVLWKPSPPELPGWNSPWGRGRPGWHIECSAMSAALLGETFDIHGGGIDLVFPHHENEIAQSCYAFHTGAMANYWMHNGFLQVEGEKMSKSLGNFVTIRELLRTGWRGRTWSGNVARLAMLGTHYRQPLDWSARRLEDSERELFSISGELLQVAQTIFHNDTKPFAQWLTSVQEPADEQFIEALCDDLNTPGAISAIRQKFGKIASDLKIAGSVLSTLEFAGVVDRRSVFMNSSPVLRGIEDRETMHGVFLAGRKLQIAMLNGDQEAVDGARSFLDSLGIQIDIGENVGSLTFLSRDPKTVQAQKEHIERLVATRNVARAAKNWKESDRIRDELAAMGVVLKDSKEGTTWEIAR